MNSEDNIARYKEQYWNNISTVISNILLPSNKKRIYFEQVYSSVYKCVCEGFSENLRMDILNLCMSYLHSINHELDNKVSVLDEPQKVIATVEELNQCMDAYLISTEKICSVCSYMNKLQREDSKENLPQSALLDCFCRIVCDHRLQHIISFIENSPPFTIQPTELRTFFRNLHFTSSGQYAKLYPELFSRYIANVLPEMREQDLEAHIRELSRLQADWRTNMEARCPQQGLKRPAED
ncbi:CDK2-associated and cullin domain-containing protein 1 [Nilaparvata lugens]|uniref:CDK2-associated and cullin domain-containing protein 1 n=1 Tax=Nilaparvata lugens TaxID=108931 RepID=UPI000B97EAFF|nr:CDK2-associated and cullin domain-containing protein 1 [Nilaparvata lugens]